MFDGNNKIYIQKQVSTRLHYSVNSGDKVFGSVQEVKSPSTNLKDIVMKLVSLLTTSKHIIIEKLEFHVYDGATQVGTIRKKAGFNTDLELYSIENEILATVKSTVKISAPSIQAVDKDGCDVIKASGGYGATDLNVLDCQTGEQVSTILRRSLVYKTIRDNFMKNDVYHIDRSTLDSNKTLAIIGIVLALSLYFHGGQ